MNTGDRFTDTITRPYHLNGEQGVHVYTLLAEVVSTNAVGFEYEVVEVLTETDRPPFAGRPTGGSFAWFGWDAALQRGDVKAV